MRPYVIHPDVVGHSLDPWVGWDLSPPIPTTFFFPSYHTSPFGGPLSMGCTQGKHARTHTKTRRVKEYNNNNKRKEQSERTLNSEPTYHIKTEDYKANPPITNEPVVSQSSVSRDNNTVTISSNKDDTLDEGIDVKDKPVIITTPPPLPPPQDCAEQPQPQLHPQPPQPIQPTAEESPGMGERKGSIIRNGVYYSESELSEEAPWQPKYWTSDRIGKWVEDTEFPDGLKFQDVCKIVIQNNMTVPRPRANPQHQSPINNLPQSSPRSERT